MFVGFLLRAVNLLLSPTTIKWYLHGKLKNIYIFYLLLICLNIQLLLIILIDNLVYQQQHCGFFILLTVNNNGF